MDTHWEKCLSLLRNELSDQQFNTWIRPLQTQTEDNVIRILAPNRFVLDWIQNKYKSRIEEIFYSLASPEKVVSFEVGSLESDSKQDSRVKNSPRAQSSERPRRRDGETHSPLNGQYQFENFIEGKSNRVSRAAVMQVAETFGAQSLYNPLFIYGGVGLGKTHLVHACGNLILKNHPGTNVGYISSERFVSDMVSALQHNRFEAFKARYHAIEVLLVDDIQFLSGKERSQEEFFHLFNAMLEGQRQIVMTCDRYPKDLDDMQERLRSRFAWGLTTAIEPPELETRTAILMSKSRQFGTPLTQEVAFYIASRIHSHVRDLEGALRNVIALAKFTRKPIDRELADEALKDLLSAQRKQISVENIQRAVANHYKIRVADLLSKSRKVSVARPRQLAMALAKELTNLSLPEIGNLFGGRDHTTVIHACHRIEKLRQTSESLDEDYNYILRTITT